MRSNWYLEVLNVQCQTDGTKYVQRFPISGIEAFIRTCVGIMRDSNFKRFTKESDTQQWKAPTSIRAFVIKCLIFTEMKLWFSNFWRTWSLASPLAIWRAGLKSYSEMLFAPLLDYIFREQLKLETSNLTRRLATSGPKQKNAKWGQRKSWRGHVTYVLKL